MKKNYLILSIIGVIVFILIIFAISSLVSNEKKSNKEMTFSELLNSESIFSSVTVYYGTTIAVYPSPVSRTYFNLNIDGILYKFNDNGYNLTDPEGTIVLVSQKNLINNSKNQLIKELETLRAVAPNELLQIESNITYINITFTETKTTKTVYKEEFENIINKYLQ